MNRLGVAILIVLIYTFLLLNLSSGIYLYLNIFYIETGPEYSVSFEGGVIPSAWQFLFSGFYDFQQMGDFVVIALVVSLFFEALRRSFFKESSWLLKSIILTVLVLVCYFVYCLLYALSFDEGYWSIYLVEVKYKLIVVGVLCLIASPLLAGLKRLMAYRFSNRG